MEYKISFSLSTNSAVKQLAAILSAVTNNIRVIYS